MLESTRKKEEDVKRETTEQLEIFRRQQEEADKALLRDRSETDDTKATGAGDPEAGESQWAVNARKRKRAKEKEGLKGIKLRKSSSTIEAPIGIDQELHELGKEGATTPPKPSLDAKRAEKSDSKSQALPATTLTKKTSTATIAKAESPRSSNATGLGLAGYSSDEGD